MRSRLSWSVVFRPLRLRLVLLVRVKRRIDGRKMKCEKCGNKIGILESLKASLADDGKDYFKNICMKCRLQKKIKGGN